LSLKLRFDRYLIDNRPYRFDLPPVELVEHVFCKGDFASVDLKPDETTSWRAIESEAARDATRLTDQELNVEIKVRDFTKIPLQHFAIARQPDRFAVVTRRNSHRRTGSFNPLTATYTAGWISSYKPLIFNAGILI